MTIADLQCFDVGMYCMALQRTMSNEHRVVGGVRCLLDADLVTELSLGGVKSILHPGEGMTIPRGIAHWEGSSCDVCDACVRQQIFEQQPCGEILAFQST